MKIIDAFTYIAFFLLASGVLMSFIFGASFGGIVFPIGAIILFIIHIIKNKNND